VTSIFRLLGIVAAASVLATPPAGAVRQTTHDDPTVRTNTAVVLGGGGLTGQSWQIGMLKGLRDAGFDLTQADMVIGTSGGSVAATQMRSGFIDDFYAALLGPPALDNALDSVDLAYYQETARMWQGAEITPDTRIAVGARALAAVQVIPEEEFITRTGVRVGVPDWPTLPLQITAVDVFDGTTRLIDRTQGVSIAQAVAASTAQPALVAPISIGSSRYMDGGVAGSPLAPALGYRRIMALLPGGGGAVAQRAAEAARAQGIEVLILSADSEAAEARGPDSQDPTRMAASAEAGLRQAARAASDVAVIWNETTSNR